MSTINNAVFNNLPHYIREQYPDMSVCKADSLFLISHLFKSVPSGQYYQTAYCSDAVDKRFILLASNSDGSITTVAYDRLDLLTAHVQIYKNLKYQSLASRFTL